MKTITRVAIKKSPISEQSTSKLNENDPVLP